MTRGDATVLRSTVVGGAAHMRTFFITPDRVVVLWDQNLKKHIRKHRGQRGTAPRENEHERKTFRSTLYSNETIIIKSQSLSHYRLYNFADEKIKNCHNFQ